MEQLYGIPTFHELVHRLSASVLAAVHLAHRRLSFKEFMLEWIISNSMINSVISAWSVLGIGISSIANWSGSIMPFRLGSWLKRRTVWWNPDTGVTVAEREWLDFMDFELGSRFVDAQLSISAQCADDEGWVTSWPFERGLRAGLIRAASNPGSLLFTNLPAV